MSLLRRSELAVLSVFVLVGAFLRIYRIGEKSLWLDEAMSVWFARHPIIEIVSVQPASDVHPPLYYLLLGLWIRVFGDGESEVRLLSAFFGVFSIPLLFLIANDLFGKTVALISALVLSLSPFHIYYSQEARMYTMVTFFVLLSVFFMERILFVRKNTRKMVSFYAFGYVISTAIAIYSHNIALLLLMAQVLFLILFFRRYKTLVWILITSCLFVFVFWLPWLSSFLKQGFSVIKSFYAPPLTLESIVSLFATFNNGPHFWLFNWMDIGFLNFFRGKLVTIALIFFSLLSVKGSFHLVSHIRPFVFVFLIFLIPLGVEILVSLRYPILAPHTLIWVSVPYYVFVSSGVASMLPRHRVLFAISLIFLVFFSLSSAYTYYSGFDKERWDLAAGFVADNSRGDELVIFNSSIGQFPFDYYFKRHGVSLKEMGFPENYREKKTRVRDLSVLEKIAHSYDRIWLIYSHEWFTDPKTLTKAALEKSHCVLKEKVFKSKQSDIKCYLFERCFR
ncbi:MAG: membrane protein [Deltaproteobacteria bacterium]|nr:MAG: membrane protein [Deltaproteobacteria bacterium]